MSTEIASTTRNVVAIDVSGSTGGNVKYWSKVADVLNQKRNENPHTKIIVWDDYAAEMPYEEVRKIIDYCRGGGGTVPSSIVSLLQPEDNLTLITDGQISKQQVDSCTARLEAKNMKMGSVEVYFQGEERYMDLSVAVPFTRNSSSFTMSVNETSLADGSIKDIDFTKYYDNIPLFMTDYEKLYRTITVKCIGKFDQEMRLQILNLQTALMNTLAKQNTEKTVGLIDCVGDIEAFRNKLLIDNDPYPLGKRIEMFIRGLLKQVDGNHNFSFDQLRQPSALLRADVAPVVLTEELPETVNVSEFECPIMLDSEVSPCLIVTEGEPVFKGVDPGYLKSLIDFPYLTLDNNEFIEKIKARLDHPVSITAVKHIKESPYTRKKICAVLPLDAEVSPSINKALCYALAKIFFGDKLAGNMTMWFSVVYFVIKGMVYPLGDNFELGSELALGNDKKKLGIHYLRHSEDEVETDTNTEKEVDGFMIRTTSKTKSVTVTANPLIKNLEARMKSLMFNSRINLTLTGLPVEPMIKEKFSVALWYSIHSGLINGVDNDEKNRLRSFGGSARFLIVLLQLLDAPYTIDSQVVPLFKLYTAFAYMMKQSNRVYESSEAKFFKDWRLILKSQYQNSMLVDDGDRILLDGPSTLDTKPILPDRFYDLSLETLFGLEKLVDTFKSVGTISLSDVKPVPIPAPEVNYGYDYTREFEGEHEPIPICPATFRPFTNDQRDGKFWENRTVEVHGCPIDKQISAYQYYIDFVTDKKKYPTRTEFLKYMSMKQANRLGSVRTLPAHIGKVVGGVLNDYQLVTKDVDVVKFISTTEVSRCREFRVEMEKKYLEG